MPNNKYIKWNVKRGNGIYNSVVTAVIQKWISEGKIKEGEVLVWRSGMSGWRRPEELDEFRKYFRKKDRKVK